MDDSPQPQKPQPVGPMVGTVIIVLLLLAGGIYFLLVEQSERSQTPTGTEQASL